MSGIESLAVSYVLAVGGQVGGLAETVEIYCGACQKIKWSAFNLREILLFLPYVCRIL